MVPARPAADAGRIELLGLPVDALDLEETVSRVAEIVERRAPAQHVAVNAAKYVLAWRDAELAETIRGCALVNADGQSVVAAARVLGRPLPERVAGIDLFARLLVESERRSWRVYFLGSRRPVVEETVRIARERHPSLVVAGHHDGYWSSDQDVVRTVREARADVLFLAIPSPRKERWLRTYLTRLEVPFAMGVGGTFDVVSGVARRAPGWAQRAGLEWTWRLAQEPRRMIGRYAVGNSVFLAGVVRARLAGRPEDNPFGTRTTAPRLGRSPGPR